MHRGVDREVDYYDTSIVQCLTGWFGEEHLLLRYTHMWIHVLYMCVNCIHCVCCNV